MIKPDLFDYYKNMRAHNIILELRGMLSQDILVAFVELIKNKLSHEFKEKRVIKRVFSVFVELVQNVVHHSAESGVIEETDKRVGNGIVVMSENEACYVVSSGNMVEKSKVFGAVVQCDAINSMDQEELKRFYKEQIKIPWEEGESGGRVGLIDVARKSGHPIEYEVKEVDGTHSFFMVSVKVDKEEKNGKFKNT